MRRFLFGAAICALSLATAPALARSTGGLVVATASGDAQVIIKERCCRGTGLNFRPYPGFTGGVHVATGDVDGDGVADIITGAGPGGGPHVKVFDGVDLKTPTELHSFFAYDAAFTGGVFVASGDIDGDGRADIITGAGPGGGPNVKVFQGGTGELHRSFFAYDASFTGGVSVAAGDLNGDGFDDIVTGAGPGGGPHVKVFDGTTGAEIRSFFAFDPQFLGGVSVATGQFFGTGALFVGAGAGGNGHVKVFSLSDHDLLADFFAFGGGFDGGINVATGFFQGQDFLFVGQGRGGGRVEGYALKQNTRGRGGLVPAFDIAPFGDDFTGGVSVAGFAGNVPEPAVWLQLIAGFGIAGATMRGRRRAAA